MNVAQMLSYGPKLTKTYCASRPKTDASRHKVSDKTIDKYRALSENGMIWSTLIAPKVGLPNATVSRYLKDMYRRDYLEECGKVESSTSSNKPILYKWKNA